MPPERHNHIGTANSSFAKNDNTLINSPVLLSLLTGSSDYTERENESLASMMIYRRILAPVTAERQFPNQHQLRLSMSINPGLDYFVRLSSIRNKDITCFEDVCRRSLGFGSSLLRGISQINELRLSMLIIRPCWLSSWTKVSTPCA